MLKLMQHKGCPERLALLRAVADMVAAAFEAGYHGLSEAGSVAVTLKRKRHVPTKDLLEIKGSMHVIQDGDDEEEQKMAKRLSYLKRTSGQLKLSRQYFLCRRLWKPRAAHGCVHVAVDAGRTGGRDAEIGLAYDVGTNTCVWLPPIEPAVTTSERKCLV